MKIYDAMGPITAYRAWQVAGSTLCSVTMPDKWNPETPAAIHTPDQYNFATTTNNLSTFLPSRMPKHSAPQTNCTCGYYSVKQPELLASMNNLPNIAFGEVEIFGRVVEHQYGYRSEYARVTKLFGGFATVGISDRLLQRYGIEVVHDQEVLDRISTAPSFVTVSWNTALMQSIWTTSTNYAPLTNETAPLYKSNSYTVTWKEVSA